MTANYLAADVADLIAHVDALLTAFPELADDDDLKAGMLEGSTSLYEVLGRLITIERDADSMTKAITSRIADLNARKDRASKRKDAMRTLMLRIMQAAGVPKASLPEATVSVTKGRDSVEIVDELKLPHGCTNTVTTPNKTEIMKRLADNQNVPGARIKTGEATLTVRAA